MKKAALVVSGLVFSIVAILHIVRYVKGWQIIIDQFTVPMNSSIFAAIVSGILAIWMFMSACDCKK